MKRPSILAIDQGTTNTKALLLDCEGNVLFRSSAPVELLQPQTGFVEQNPLELWQSVCRAAEDCARFPETSIVGIAISNQRETALAWARTRPGTQRSSPTPSLAPPPGMASPYPQPAGTPIGNAISWQCRRSESECERVRQQAPLLQEMSGLPLDPLLTATKWAWMFSQQPELQARAEAGDLCLGTVDSWLLYNLTGGVVHATDHTNASRTALLGLGSLQWEQDLLRLFGIPRAALAEVRPSASLFGECIAVESLRGVPVVAMVGDSHAALVGHGGLTAGMVKATYGTGSSLMMLTAALPSPTASLARTVAWSSKDSVHYALEGNIAMSGAALQWVGEFLGLPHPAEDAAELAATVPDAGGVVLVPAMVGLGAPHWASAARGLIANLERSHTSAHLARAALDAIAAQVADVLEAMQNSSGSRATALLADGGAACNDSLMQIQADLIGCDVLRSAQMELSARGAAMLGGQTLGWWSASSQPASSLQAAHRFQPRISAGERHRQRCAWRLALERTLYPRKASSA